VRLLTMPIEGRLAGGFRGPFDVGTAFRVQLISVDVDKGFNRLHEGTGR